ncbi:MAG: hypothetical protein IT292_05835 [Deltaproteobacteria bacterium]|nr:hypothetical protein [Deltaproteobacteria bacterium]
MNNDALEPAISLLAKIKRRLLLHLIANNLLLIAPPLTALACAFYYLFNYRHSHLIQYPLLIVALLLTIIIYLTFHQKLSSIQAPKAAAILDSFFKTKERFLTSIFSSQPADHTDAFELIKEQLNNELGEQPNKLSTIAPWHIQRSTKISLLFLPFAFLLFFMLYYYRPQPSPLEILAQHHADEIKALIAQSPTLSPELVSKLEDLANTLEDDGLLAEETQETLAAAEKSTEQASTEKSSSSVVATEKSINNNISSAHTKEDQASSRKEAENQESSHNSQSENKENKAQSSSSPEKDKQSQEEQNKQNMVTKQSSSQQQDNKENAEQQTSNDNKQNQEQKEGSGAQSSADIQGSKSNPNAGNKTQPNSQEQSDQGNAQAKTSAEQNNITEKQDKSTKGEGQKQETANNKQDSKGQNKSDQLSNVQKQLEQIKKDQQEAGGQGEQKSESKGKGKQDNQQQGQNKDNASGQKAETQKPKNEANSKTPDKGKTDKDKQTNNTSPAEKKQDGNIKTSSQQNQIQTTKPSESNNNFEKQAAKLPEQDNKTPRFDPYAEQTAEKLLGPDKKLVKVEIPDDKKPTGDNQGKEDKLRYVNKSPAQAKTAIGDKDFAKPEDNSSLEKQPIPVEYQEFLR